MDPLDHPDAVVVCMTMQEAETLSLGLSDLLCWCAGFNAALPEDRDRHPMGVHSAREVNIKLKSAMSKAEKYGAAK